MKAGAVDYLPKPFRDEDLLYAVKRALQRSSEQWFQRSQWEEIHSIIPGRIRPTKGSKQQIRLEIKYFTGTGLKAFAKTGTAVQEVFFVTANPQAVRPIFYS